MAAYINPEQFLRLYDQRLIRQELSDTGSPVAGSLDGNQNLLDALAMASEVIAAAALVGERYSAEELQAIADSTTTGFLLRRLTADLAFAMIVARRGRAVDQIDKIAPARAWAEQQLDLLRSGTHLFPGTEDTKAPAGLPAVSNLNNGRNGPIYNCFTTTANRVFPGSCSRIPRPGNGCCGC